MKVDPNDPKCGKEEKLYCKFDITFESDETHIETCVFCGKRLVYPKINGIVNNVKYKKDHKRDFIQADEEPELFIKLYGQKHFDQRKELMKFLEKNKAPTPGEFKEEIMRITDGKGLGV